MMGSERILPFAHYQQPHKEELQALVQNRDNGLKLYHRA